MNKRIIPLLFFGIIILVFGVQVTRQFRFISSNDNEEKAQLDKPAENNSTQFSLEDFSKSSADLVEKVLPSVVSINTKTRLSQVVPGGDLFDLLFGGGRMTRREYLRPGLGSGVIISKKGYIITNNHVVANVDEISVVLNGGKSLPAKLVGTDKYHDIAILKIEGRNYPALPLADSDKVRVGEIVYAIGNPFGLNETVTQGIISARERKIRDGGMELFQTDTVINPGNSGGPLINVRGEIIGINVAIFNNTQNRQKFWQGVGFSIPSNIAKFAFKDIISGKNNRERGVLGVRIGDIGGVYGAIISSVERNSPAYHSGLQVGDVIVAIGRDKVDSSRKLIEVIRRKSAGDRVKVTFMRDGKKMQASAVLAKASRVF